MTRKFFNVSMVIIVLFSPLVAAIPARANGSLMLITEVQTGVIDGGGQDHPLQEFIEITNTFNGPLTIPNGVQVQYLSSANDGSGAPTAVLGNLAGNLAPNQTVLLSHDGYLTYTSDGSFGVGDNSSSGMLAKTGGHVRLEFAGMQLDCVSWGSAVAIPDCDKISSLATAGQSIQRPYVNGVYDKSLGVQNVSPTSPGQLNIKLDSAPVDGSPDPESNNCQGVVVDEILANPAGNDSGHEYVELHNTTSQAVGLQGCSLKVGSRSYDFSVDDVLAAGQYKAYYDDVTGLQITNGGGTVQLLGSGDQPIDYPSASDDQVWALINGVWQTTDQVTPNQANLISLNVGVGANDTSAATKTCPAGKFLNPATNRCKNLPAVTTRKPCQSDQVRNSATGRCRKIAAASTTAKSCAANQQRNPATGRCRKIAAGSKTVTAKQDKSDPKTKPSYWIMAVVASCIVGYGLYEYRSDLTNRWNWVRQKLNQEPSAD